MPREHGVIRVYGTVVPSNMNPVGAEDNIFSALFDRVPAKRAGSESDMAGTILYLVSRAGVGDTLRLDSRLSH